MQTNHCMFLDQRLEITCKSHKRTIDFHCVPPPLNLALHITSNFPGFFSASPQPPKVDGCSPDVGRVHTPASPGPRSEPRCVSSLGFFGVEFWCQKNQRRQKIYGTKKELREKNLDLYFIKTPNTCTRKI